MSPVALARSWIERWNHWQRRSVNRRIFAASVAVAGLTLLVKASGFLKELLVALYFGTSDALDAFLIALLVPTFSANVIAGALPAAFVPACMRARASGGAERPADPAVQALLSQVLLIALVALGALSLLLALAGRPLLAVTGSSFGPQKAALAHALFLLLLPSLILSALCELGSALLNARERFALAAASPMLVPLSVAGALLVLGDAAGIHALAFGTLAGLLAQTLLVGWEVRRQGFHLRPRWHGMTPALQQFIAQYLPMVGGLLLMSGNDLIDQSMAAMLGSGSVSSLAYGNRIVSAVLALSSTALSTAVLPHFSGMAAGSDWAGLRHTLRTYGRTILAVSVPLALALALLSQPIVRLVFERGAFTPRDTQVVAQVQALYALQIPFYALGILGVRLLSALGKNQVLMGISFVNLVANATGNYILMRWLGVAGIALSTSLVYALSTALVAAAVAAQIRRQPRSLP